MKVRIFAAAALAATLAVAASTAPRTPSATGSAAASKITVWLQVDAQSGWPDLVAAANAQFQARHPGVDVNVQYQTWADHLQKFDATLAGGNAARRHRDGEHRDDEVHGGGRVPGPHGRQGVVRELEHLARGPRRVGRLRRQDLRRPVLRGLARRHLPQRPVQARRSSKVPTSLAQFTAGARKLAQDEHEEGLLAGLHRRHRLVLRDELRLRLRRIDRRRTRQRQVGRPALDGQVARRPARLQELLQRRVAGEQDRERGAPAAVRRLRAGPGGLDRRPRLVQLLRRQEVHGRDEAVRDAEPHEGPGHAGLPRRLRPRRAAGASDKALGDDWIRAFTSTGVEKGLQAKGNIPNATNLLGTSVNERAAARSWFVPTAKNWVNVENGNILRTMLAQILTGKSTIKQATSLGRATTSPRRSTSSP